MSLGLLLHRVCADRAVMGRLLDARELMGLRDVSGLLTQVIVDVAAIDPDAPALALLACHLARLREHGEMAGGPALTEDSTPPTVVFDPKTAWLLPDGWRLVEAFEARSGALLLRGLQDGKSLRLVANACDGAKPAALRAVLTPWAEILATIVREPNTSWSSLALGAGCEPETICDTPSATPGDATVQDVCARVYEHVSVDPELPAVRRGEQVLARRALLSRIGDLAAALGQLEPGAVVGVLAGPDPDLVAAWLAVLWRGGAFLPLSPVEPPRRIERALADAGASAVFVGTGSPALTPQNACRVLRLADIVTGDADPGPPLSVDPDQVGYLLPHLRLDRGPEARGRFPQ